MLDATLRFYATKIARLSFSATEAPTRKSGEPTSMRIPATTPPTNLFRLLTCRTTVVWSMAHTQLSLATTTSRFSLDPETLYNYCIRHPLAKYKPKSGSASPEPTKKGFFFFQEQHLVQRICRTTSGTRGSPSGCGNCIHRKLIVSAPPASVLLQWH